MLKRVIVPTLVCIGILIGLMLMTSESKFLPLIYRVF
jgi:hypothetical protein